MKPGFVILFAAGLMAAVIACDFTYIDQQTLGTAAALTVEALMPEEDNIKINISWYRNCNIEGTGRDAAKQVLIGGVR